MHKEAAAVLADEFIKITLQHQSNLLGVYPLASESSAQQAAKSLAALRAELISQLEEQS